MAKHIVVVTPPDILQTRYIDVLTVFNVCIFVFTFQLQQDIDLNKMNNKVQVTIKASWILYFIYINNDKDKIKNVCEFISFCKDTQLTLHSLEYILQIK